MTKPRVGIVGLGQMGRVHARNANDCGGQVVGGADIDEDIRESFGRAFDVPTVADIDSLLEVEPLDAVVITTPNRFHEEAAVATLDAGCHVLVEKPLAHGVESAERIVEAGHRSSGFGMVGFHNRFAPATSAVRAYRDDGRFGEISHIEATYVRRRGIPGRGTWFTNASVSGGGALVDIGVHVVDLALHLLDFPVVTEATGVTRTNFGPADDYDDPEGFSSNWDGGNGPIDVEDSVSAFVRCATGQTISLEVAWATNRPTANELVVRGTRAGARFELDGDTAELYETSPLGVDHYVTTEIDAAGGPDGHTAEMQCFLDAVAAGDAPEMNTLEQGLAVQRTLEAIYRSSEEGRAQVREEPSLDPAD